MSTGSVLGVQEREDFEEQIMQDTSTLNFLACQSGFTVKDVPRDGNCLFTAVEIQLPRLGIQLGEESLRKQLVNYLQHHPYTNDGTTLLRDLLLLQFSAPMPTMLTQTWQMTSMSISPP